MNPKCPTLEEMTTSFDTMIKLRTCFEIRRELGKESCKHKCFMENVSSFEEDQKRLSDFTIAKIKLGLQVVQFDPCHLRLFCDKDEVTCDQIYKYLEQEYNETRAFPQYYAKMEEAVPIQKIHKRGKCRKAKKHHYTNQKNLEQNCRSKYCTCFQTGFCDKYCGCDLSKCKIIRKGCNCESTCIGKQCPCHSFNAECDPDLCKCCFTTSKGKKINNCQNQHIYFEKGKKCKVGPSDVCPGLGLFNVEPIQKGEFVGTYIGELISLDEADMRERGNKFDQENYLTTLNDDFVIDAKYLGNKTRFINHGKSYANIVAKYSYSKGLYHFAFFAKEDIAPGSELLFNYEGGGSNWKELFPWMKNPSAPKLRPQTFEKDSIPLVSGAKVSWIEGYLYKQARIAFKMEFKLNSKPRKFLKIEDSHVRDRDLNDNNVSGYFAYQENLGDEDVSTPQTVTTTQSNELFRQFIATDTCEYGSGIFPIPILDVKTEPVNRGIDMSYEDSLFQSLMNAGEPMQRTTSKKINLRQLEEWRNKSKVVALSGSKEEDAISIE